VKYKRGEVRKKLVDVIIIECNRKEKRMRKLSHSSSYFIKQLQLLTCRRRRNDSKRSSSLRSKCSSSIDEESSG
jgi:hypothetical protein